MTYQFYILKKQQFKEKQSLFTILTHDDSLLKVIGQGQTKLQCQSIQSFQKLEAPIKISARSTLHTMRKPESLEGFYLTGPHLFAGMYLNELIIKLSNEGPQSTGLFDLYHRTLLDIQRKKDLAPTIRKFEIILLELQGYGIDLTRPNETPISVQNGEWQYFEKSPWQIGDIIEILEDKASLSTCKKVRSLTLEMITTLMPSQSLNTLKWLQSVYC